MTRQSLISACLALQMDSEYQQDNIPDSDSRINLLIYWRYCRAWWYAERALIQMGEPEDNGTVERSIKNCSRQIAKYAGGGE